MALFDRYQQDVEAIRATGTSSAGWVTVTREPSGQLDVRIRPGLLRTCPREEVAAEIRSGLLAALADHRRQFRQLRIDYFGGPLGVSLFDPPPAPSARSYQI